ncbi:hypothetical protein TELCIR_20813, partial [Teladorsagia circumcincta]
DGCALYEAVAVIFIAQINQVQLRADQIVTIRDRIRTSLNVIGDGFAASVVENSLRKPTSFPETAERSFTHHNKRGAIQREPDCVDLKGDPLCK